MKEREAAEKAINEERKRRERERAEADERIRKEKEDAERRVQIEREKAEAEKATYETNMIKCPFCHRTFNLGQAEGG